MLGTTLDKNSQSVAPQSRVSVRYPICPSPSYLLNNPSKNLSWQSMSLSIEHLSNNNLQTTTGWSFSHQIGAMRYKNIEFVKDILYFNSNLVIKPRSYISILICCQAWWLDLLSQFWFVVKPGGESNHVWSEPSDQWWPSDGIRCRPGAQIWFRTRIKHLHLLL